MATNTIIPAATILLLLLPFSLPTTATTIEVEEGPSPYLFSLSLFYHDYRLMLRSLKIHAYTPIHNSTSFPSSSPLALFHDALLRSPFLTPNPHSAHLFYLTSPIDHPRHLARSVRTLRSSFPFWNRSLGSDHFFLTLPGLDPASSDRNLLELSKNSIQISPSSPPPSSFFPHKDLTLPPPLDGSLPDPSSGSSFRYLAFYNGPETLRISAILADLRGDPDVLVELGRLDPADREEAMASSRFCLFFYGEVGVGSIGEALRMGCVPVVAAERAPLDLPFGDVLRWGEMVVVVRLGEGAAGVRRAMAVVEGKTYRRMRNMGIRASEHFRWSSPGEVEEQDKVDVFRTVLYQLWRRRHTIRYSSWEVTGDQ